MADQDLAALPTIQRWHATGDYAYPAEEREDGEFVEYEAYCALARENADRKHQMRAVWKFLEPNASNDMEWADEIIIAIEQRWPVPCGKETICACLEFRQRAERAEAELAAMKRRIAEAVTITPDVGEDGDYINVWFSGDENRHNFALLPVGGEGQ